MGLEPDEPRRVLLVEDDRLTAALLKDVLLGARDRIGRRFAVRGTHLTGLRAAMTRVISKYIEVNEIA